LSDDYPGQRRGVPPDPEPPDAGEPIHALADFGHVPSRSFLDRFRNRLHRRSVGTQAASFAWHAPFMVCIEFVNVIFGFFEAPDRPKGDSQ
jgi:hypothetical protein